MQLHHVVSDITGATGMRVIRAIVEGERNPATLAQMRDVRCHASTETICSALTSNWRDEHVFALCQSLALFDFYQLKIVECDRKLEIVLRDLEGGDGYDIAGLPKVRTRTKQVNAPDFEVRSALYRVLGVDLTQIHGIGPTLALKLVGECGTDLAAWPSSKHFTSWLCLAPGNKISGGKLLSSKTCRSSSRAAALLRLAATTIGRTDTALGAFYRRLSARAGKAKAVTATARKLAVLFYNALRHGMAYSDLGAAQYEERYRSRVIGPRQGLRLRAPGTTTATRDSCFLGKPPPTSRGTRYEVQLYREAPRDLAGGMDMRALGVSRSGFHAWLTRAASQRSRDDEKIGARIRASHIGSYRTYGARRVWHDILAEGYQCGLYKIERLMREQGLRARRRRRVLPTAAGIFTADCSVSILRPACPITW